MTDPAVLSSEQQQRKEVRRKEAAMPPAHQDKTEDRETPLRAAIYLSEPVPDDQDEPRDDLSLDEQAALCRYGAKTLACEVVGEFIDMRTDLISRPGRVQALSAARKQRLDLLIVSSPDRLADNCYDALRVTWQLGRLGTIPLPAEVGFLPSPTEARSSRG